MLAKFMRSKSMRSKSMLHSDRGHPAGSLVDLVFGSVGAAIALVLLTGTFALGQSNKPQPQNKPVGGGAVARGKYIVESVAMCGQCHTPHDTDGSPERARWLQGAPVPWQPTKPDSNWPISAPRIGRTPLPASDEDMIKLLTTGIWTTGSQLRAPMPQFRMDRGDAEAVVAYLKSLTAQQ
ncbi:MAG TPA: c-type cytochrome [Candidatus Sulfotelmatobacter sp.]